MANMRPHIELDLGGGFTYVRRDDTTAVRVPALGDRVLGLMSTASTNARDETAISAWLARWQLQPQHGLRSCNQVHGITVLEMGRDTLSSSVVKPEADGMWTEQPDLGLVVKAADCAPVWVASESRVRLVIVHAGWRGVAAGIIQSALRALHSEASVGRLRAAIGPHLQACCFEVGPEVAVEFASVRGAVLPATSLCVPRQRSDSIGLDLSVAIEAVLRAGGVRPADIYVSSACTRCHPEMFHSYRRNGTGGPLMAAVGMLAA